MNNLDRDLQRGEVVIMNRRGRSLPLESRLFILTGEGPGCVRLDRRPTALGFWVEDLRRTPPPRIPCPANAMTIDKRATRKYQDENGPLHLDWLPASA